MSAIRASVGSAVVVGASVVDVVLVVVEVVGAAVVTGAVVSVVDAMVSIVVVGSASSLPEQPAATSTVSGRARTISDRIVVR